MLLCVIFQEVGWSGQGARILGMKGKRYKLWWCGEVDGVGGVGYMVRWSCVEEW